MAVDRRGRDELAGHLAAFLRGEIDRDALRARLDALSAGPEDAYLHGLLTWGLRHVPERLSEREWGRLRRHLAFLRTDLEERRVDLSFPDEDRPFQIRLARWHLAGLAAALALWPLAGWWPLATAWVASFALFMLQVHRHDAARDNAWQDEVARRVEFAPFASEEDWLAHAGLLEPFRLPAYEARLHAAPKPRPAVLRIGSAVLTAAAAVLIVGVIGFMYACSMPLWPVWLAGMSVMRR
jgi:hypothetical protein